MIYACGFAFDRWGQVALIRKRRPAWQAGFLNGVGGHVEEGEAPAVAMAREFEEETGLTVTVDRWRAFALCLGDDFTVWMFSAFDVPVELAQSRTDEPIVVVPALDLPRDVLWNLRWLIPMAAEDTLSGDIVMVRYRGANEASTGFGGEGPGPGGSR